MEVRREAPLSGSFLTLPHLTSPALVAVTWRFLQMAFSRTSPDSRSYALSGQSTHCRYTSEGYVILACFLLGAAVLPSLRGGCWVFAQHLRAVQDIPLSQCPVGRLKPRAIQTLAVLLAQDPSNPPRPNIGRPRGWIYRGPQDNIPVGH